MRIEPPADDYGTRALRRANARTALAPAQRTERYPAVAGSAERREPVPGTAPRLYMGPDRRVADKRRQGDRRRRDEPVLLDTRSHRERRQRLRRQSDRTAAGTPPARERDTRAAVRRGVDVMA